MADAVVSGLVKVILENLSKGVVQEFGIAWGLKKELEKLESTLTTIQAVLQDADEKQVQSEALRNWLWKLKDAAYDADDIVDEFATKALQQRVDTGKNAMRVVNNFFSRSNPCLYSLNMGHKIKKIGERLDMIAAERSKFHLREGVEDRQHETGQRLQTDSLVMESEIYGRVQEKKKIVDLMLTDASDKMDVSVIPIVGMGGLGKTTLAQLAYNDERVVKHFELRTWVCVSEDFDIRRIIKAILKSAHVDASDLTELDHLQCRLQETLHTKRFLLVLDDVWNEHRDKWDRLRKGLECRGKGSTIIVTTRIEKVARIMGTFPIQNLPYLSENECWSLFRHRAFGYGREERENLTAIGKEIVKKCRGVPLAAKTLGGLMYFKTEESEWSFVKESEIWELPQEPDGIIPALRLSYKHLPSHLKRCFTYCCLFSKNSEIRVEEVILQWMANGFIPFNLRKDPEDIGHEYFNELLWRSFFQDVKKDKDCNIIMCKMHDLLHDLARSVAGDEHDIMQTYQVDNVAKTSRHISCNIFESVNESQTLRTVLLKGIWDQKILGCLLRFRCLRVLDLHLDWIKVLPPSIGNLIHLRYLNLSGNLIEKLPESICRLKNLQTLKLKGTSLSNLPKGLKNMCSLRHLDIRHLELITKLPKRIGKLTHLQTLSFFIVGKKSGRCIGELKDLIKLRGDLEICNLELVRNKADAKEANLISKQNLHTLILSWRKCDTSSNINNEDVFEGLQPHSNIKRLDVNGFGGIRLPTWFQDSKFSNLVKISLFACRRCEYLPSLGLLPSLENLEIYYMDAVKYIGCEFYGEGSNMKRFPSLKELLFMRMPNLEEWLGVNGTDIFPCLQKLDIEGCPKLRTLPYFPSLKYLSLTECSSAMLMSVGNLSSLVDLAIYDCNSLISLPEEMIGGLTGLLLFEVSGCRELTSLPNSLQSLPSLRSIEIRHCPKMDLPTYLHHLSKDYLGISIEIRHCPRMACYFLMFFDHKNVLYEAQIDMYELRARKQLPKMMKTDKCQWCPSNSSLFSGLASRRR